MMEWIKNDIDKDLVKSISSSYKISPLAAAILVRRGITKPGDIIFYLESDLRYLHNPFLFDEMEDAVDRIIQAASEEEKVIILGDRDVDGITSTVILKKALGELGIDAMWSLPEGDEPYGVTVSTIDKFAADDGSLIITVDCGISNISEIAYAAELGIDTIVIDHHLPSDELPPAVAIVNPRIPDSSYPFEHLAGCGVAAKLIWALNFSNTDFYKMEIVLLNVKPGNGTYILEASRVVNLIEQERITENIVPGLVSLEQTRLGSFLIGRHIFVYEGDVQLKMMKKVFGADADIHLYDLAEVLWKEYPALKGKSLLQMREKSRASLYSSKPVGEMDILFNLFKTYIDIELGLNSTVFNDSLDLIALGTIADMMPLKDENRILVKKGMEILNRTERKGLHELLFQQNMLGKKINTTDVGWQITPVINATGRMGQPGKAARLFITESEEERRQLAQEVLSMNKARKKLGESVWDRVVAGAEKRLEETDGKMVIVVDRSIKRGITGIIASRLVSYFGVPAMVIAYIDNNLVGSVRSINGFKVKEFLQGFSEYFIDFGGHDYAAGFSLKEEYLEKFLFTVKRSVIGMDMPEKTEKTITVDAELPLSYIEPELIKTVELFEPYGEGNPPLQFMARKMKILSIDLIGRSARQHVKMLLDSGRYKWPGLFWKAAERVGIDFSEGDLVDVVFRLGRNYYQNTESLQLTILDVKRS